MVIQRINAHYGWACVGRIVLQQDRVGRGARRAPEPTVDPARRGEIAQAVSVIEHDGLRDALDRLGLAVVATSPRR